MKEIIRIALEQTHDASRLHFAIQTNGSLFTKEIITFLEEHNFSVGISLDGSDEYSNSLRPTRRGPSALDYVIKLLRDYNDFVIERCGFLAVVSRTSVRQIPSFALWLQEHKIQSLSISFLDLVGAGSDLTSEQLTPDEAVDVYRQMVSLIREGAIRDLAFNSLLSRINNLFSFQPRDFCHKGPCGASSEFLVLDAEGNYRTCDCIYNAYFKISGGVDMAGSTSPARLAIRERHVWLQKSGVECSTCSLFGLCGGTCVAKAIAKNGTPHSVDPIECAISKYIYPELLQEFASSEQKLLFNYYEIHRGNKQIGFLLG